MNKNKKLSELDIQQAKFENALRVVDRYIEFLGIENPSKTLILNLLRQADSLEKNLSQLSNDPVSQEIVRLMRDR